MSKTKDEIFQYADFNIDDCHTLETIENKLIYLADKEKNILEEYKEYDTILQPKVYNQLYALVMAPFDDCRRQLYIRRDALLKSKLVQETTQRKMTAIKEDARAKTENRYEIRLLRYKNRLHRRKCYLKHKINRKNAKAEYKTELVPILAEIKQSQQSLPP